MKTLTSSVNGMVTTQEEFQECISADFPFFLERASGIIKRNLQDMGQWANDTSHEKSLRRLSFDLVVWFIEYCPSQLPGHPTLLLDGFISEFLERFQESNVSLTSNSILYRFIEGLLRRAVVSRDALICLFYHFYGMKPAEVGCILGLDQGETLGIYKVFERWRQKGWHQAVKDIGLTDRELYALTETQLSQPKVFQEDVGKILKTLTPFCRKSEPPNNSCLDEEKWYEMFREGYGCEFRMWHLPLCQSCMNTIAKFRNAFWLNATIPSQLHLHISPHVLKKETGRRPSVAGNISSSGCSHSQCPGDIQIALGSG
ncbi:MAG TPA: hypothetical protein VLA60_15520 [Nitrospirales bacterium]|nr:hypothetical protein [Nitrospirales bacterium]